MSNRPHYFADLRASRRQNGLCVSCGERKPENQGCRRCTLYMRKLRGGVSREERARNYVGRRWYWILKKFGLTKDQYLEILEAQHGLCKICHRQPPTDKRVKFLVVDHDHKTGKRRGLLCNTCNINLGKIEKGLVVNYLWQAEAIEYLSQVQIVETGVPSAE